MLTLTLLAAHQGEEFVIILPAIMLEGAFFILRWANKNDAHTEDSEPADRDSLLEERAVGLVLPRLKTDAEVVVEEREELPV